MRKINIIALSIITSMSLQAANVPNIGDALKQVQQPKIKKEKKELPTIIQEEKDVPKELKDGKKIEIKKFLINGAKYLSNDKLKAIVKPYENQKLSFKDMQEVATLITKEYRQKGYFVARAYIPQQNIFSQDGVLKINVIEGNYGEFVLENNSLVKNEILQGNLDAIKSENIVSTNTLERAMLIINDTPGVQISKAEVRPGKEVGTSDFLIGAEASKKYSGYILGDNYGSQYTGKHRIMAGGDINSPFNIGDKISLSALSSEDAGLLNGRLAYEFPLHANGLRSEISFSKTQYELGSTYSKLDAIGNSESVSLRVDYPYIRSRLENLNVFVDFSYNKMNDELQSTNTQTKKDSYVVKVGTDYTKDLILLNKNSQTRANFSLTAGNLNFDDKSDKEFDESGAKTNGRFSKINVELGQDFELTDNLKWENSLQMQYALGNKNLDGSQDLSIGGINGVKFYPDGEASAENGYILSTELMYSLPNYKNLNSTISVFYDVGRTFMSRNITNDKSKTLKDFGVGYYASYKDMFLNAHLAKNIAHDVTAENDYSNRFMIQAGWVF